MRSKCIFFFFIFFLFWSLSSSGYDTVHHKTYYRFVDSFTVFSLQDTVKSAQYLDSMAQLAEQSHSRNLLFHYSVCNARWAYEKSDYEKALFWCDSASRLMHSSIDSALCFDLFFLYSSIYFEQGDDLTFISSFLSAQKYLDASNSPDDVIRLLNLTAIIYSVNKMPERSLHYFYLLSSYCVKFNLRTKLAASYINIAHMYSVLGTIDSSLMYSYRAISLLDSTSFYHMHLRLFAHANLASNYLSLNLAQYAKIHLDYTRYFLRKSEGDEKLYTSNLKKYLVTSMQYLSHVREYDSVIYYGNQSLALDYRLYANILDVRVYKLLAVAYENRGNLDSAVAILSQTKRMLDSFYSHRTISSLSPYQYNYLGGETDKDVFSKQQVALQEQVTKFSRSKLLIVLFVVVVFFLLLSIRLILYFNRLNQRSSFEDHQRLLELNELNNLLSIRQSSLFIEQKLLNESNNLLLILRTLQTLYLNRYITNLDSLSVFQKYLLPSIGLLESKFGRCFSLYLPKSIVSGDFYWASPASCNHRIIVLVDCAGHGISGSFLGFIGVYLLNRIILENKVVNPARIITLLGMYINLYLNQQSDDSSSVGYFSMDMSVMSYDVASHTLTCSSANSTVYLASENKVRKIKNSSLSSGSLLGEPNYTNFIIELPVDAPMMVYLSSDGYTDQLNHQNMKLGSPLFIKFVELASTLSVEEQSSFFYISFDNFRYQVDQTDDVCLLGFCFNLHDA